VGKVPAAQVNIAARCALEMSALSANLCKHASVAEIGRILAYAHAASCKRRHAQSVHLTGWDVYVYTLLRVRHSQSILSEHPRTSHTLCTLISAPKK
jgi:hypothetical protein